MTQSEPVRLYDKAYGGFASGVRQKVREETYGEDIGSTGWLTAPELRMFAGWLELGQDSVLLDVACGSGMPALYLAKTYGTQVVGVDLNEEGIRNAESIAETDGLTDRARFVRVDAGEELPFADATFDALICVDAINHLPDRANVLRDWKRVLKAGGRLLFTDPILVTGILTNEEIETRSSVGYFLFTPLGEDERFLAEAGFDLLRSEDLSSAVADVAGRWFTARAQYRDELVADEGAETFEGTQRFLGVTRVLADERRLSRYVFLARA